jgi:tetraacyldisaccharide 4'-kinase
MVPLKAPAFWNTRSAAAWALAPLGLLWGTVGLIRRHMARPYRPGIPVIAIGNLTVGGSGKTPLVAALARHFTARGETVAILSRGYGGSLEVATRVTAKHLASEVGDEPKELFDANVAAQIWVGARRAETARLAEVAGATLLLLDDGFQHVALARDVDVLTVNALTGFGNGLCLPAGPLREFLSAADHADVLAVVGNGTPNLRGVTLPTHALPFADDDLSWLKDGSVVAFCALGVPEKFFTRLREQGLNVVEALGFPDHHPYRAKDISLLDALATRHQARLVTTAKDAVKLPHVFRTRVAVVSPRLKPEGLLPLCHYLTERVTAARKRLKDPDETIVANALAKPMTE